MHVNVATYGADDGSVKQRQEEDESESADEKTEFEPFEMMRCWVAALGR
jgi:hypothetical protein